MERLRDRIVTLAMEGMCCSQIVLTIGMERFGMTDPAIVRGAFGLCGGLHSGHCCGTLSAAAFLVSLVRERTDTVRILAELCAWFTQRFGSADCAAILERNPAIAEEQCLTLVEETIERTLELVDESHGS